MFPCDYGHNHATRTAKDRCEGRNNRRPVEPYVPQARITLRQAADGRWEVVDDFGVVRHRSKHLRVAADKRRKLLR